MSSSKAIGGGAVKSDHKMKDLVPALVGDHRRINLRTIGFVGHVSEEAKTRIQRNATRASRVLATATRFAFR
jgi:hypothetical protein